VKLARASTRALARTVTAVGALAAEARAELAFKVPGRVSRLHVDLGSAVPTGAPLAELDATDYRTRVEKARAELRQTRARLGLTPDGDSDDVVPEETATVRQAKAKLEEATAQLARNRSLAEQGVLSRATLDVVEANFKVAESQYHDSLEEVGQRRAALASKRSDLALAEQQLTDTVLTAPFAGSVQQRRVDLGVYVAAGTPAVTLVKMSPIRLRLDVPEREARSIRKGAAVAVRVEGDTTVWKGVVARLSPALEESSRSLVVEAEIDNPKGLLRPGAFARAEIQADPGAPSVVVPSSSVVVFAGIEKVITIKDGKALERPVVTGRKVGEDVEIVSGLKDGESVVKEPGNLATGVPVVEAN
jgi:RND family efflux transporter MFP subunit